jgi:hypothetical protein
VGSKKKAIWIPKSLVGALNTWPVMQECST